MASTKIEKANNQSEESEGSKVKDQSPLEISASRKSFLNNEPPPRKLQTNVGAVPGRIRLLQFGSASAKFKQIAVDRDEISQSVASSSTSSIRERLNGMFERKIDWASLLRMSKEWIRDPMNMALFVWMVCVAVSGAILFFVMTGMLDSALPKKSQRNAWFEVNNQILNALFTLMCLYQHPKRFYYLVLLCRWRPEDISRLRKIYCKNGSYKPHEWAHMMLVVVLLHINCFAQYALCGLNLGYKRSDRPAIGVGICISFAIAAPAIAGVYSIISPLGRDYESEVDEEACHQITADKSKRPEQLRLKSLEKRYSFAFKEEINGVERPEWSGGILDIWEDISLAFLSLFCSFCIFGWNMERLGFGNMYVHMATFILFCVAPFWIFNLAAINIDNETVREALGVTGVVLCVFGLLYGGFWRIQLRKRFNLPSYKFCCNQPAVADCALWLCCCWCSLAQEVRTGNSYDIVENKLCRKRADNTNQLPVSPLANDNGANHYRSAPSSPLEDSYSSSKIITGNSASPSRFSMGSSDPDKQHQIIEVEYGIRGKDETTTTPPTPPMIEREA